MFKTAPSFDKPPARIATRVRASALLAFVAWHAPAFAQVYVGADSESAGVVLSNFATTQTPQLLVAASRSGERESDAADAVPTRSRSTPPSASPNALPLPPSTPELRRVIDAAALEVGISADLLHAVIAAESRYNPRALSPRGAIGLMQLLPATAKRFGAQDPYVPQQNVLAGASYLKWLMGLFQNDLELVLAAYNAGEQAVLKAGSRVPPYSETQAYVPRVLAYLRCAGSAPCKPS